MTIYLFIRFNVYVFRELLSFMYFGLESGIWDLIDLAPTHCL